MALGGGGGAYLTGPQAAFYNPANLLIHDRAERFQISLGAAAFNFEPLVFGDDNQAQIDNFRDQFLRNITFNNVGNPIDRAGLVSNLFPSNSSSTENVSQYEINFIGINWKTDRVSFGISARSRVSNRYRTGRNYYDSSSFERNGENLYQQTLRQQFQVFHEISIGYAESFEFLNGLTPNLDKFSIGIAPKLILAGAYFDASYRSTNVIDDNNNITNNRSYSQFSSGAFSDQTSQIINGLNTLNATNLAFTDNWLNEINGIGVGMDVGITYLITFGDDLSVLEGSNQLTSKSFRLSFSLTDVGLVRYTNNPLSLTKNESSGAITNLNGVSDILFEGQPGSFFPFLEQNNQLSILNELDDADDESFSSILPTALHTGFLLEINRLKLMGDFNIGLTNNAFTTDKLLTHLGIEIRPLPFLPLRAGTRLAINTPTLITLGTGIESRRFELSFAAQFTEDNLSDNLISGIAVSSITINF